MLSRVAENLYWISRYVERAETLIRLVTTAFESELEAADVGVSPLDQVLDIFGVKGHYQTSRSGRDEYDTLDDILNFLTFERSGTNSIVEMLSIARENARASQEQLSTEAWSQLNQLYLYVAHPRAQGRFLAGAYRFFQRLKRECLLFGTIIDGTLPRTEAYHFLNVGRHLERVDIMARIVSEYCRSLRVDEPDTVRDPHTVFWAGLLRTCSAFEAFQRHSREHIEPQNVIRYLLLEENFPRSMRFSVDACLRSLQSVSGHGSFSGGTIRHLGRLDSDLRYMDSDEILTRVIPFLDSVQETCHGVGGEIHHAYFRT